jgi:hypothetical protein
MDPPATRVEQDLLDAGREPPWTWSLAVGLVAFALYLALAPRAIGDGDAGELTLVLALAGAAHPPGYPLYTLLGHAWAIALHALGASWARAASSWSALGGAIAITAFHALAARLVPPSPALGARGRALVALAACGVLALHPVWTREVTIAGVNAWTLAVVIVMAAVAERWLARLATGVVPIATSRAAWSWGALCGVALAQHPTTMFVAAPLSLGLAMVARLAGLRARTAWLALGVTIGVAVACDLFIVWRAFHPAAEQWPLLEPTLASITSHVRGTLYLVHSTDFGATSADRALLATTVLPALIPGLVALWFAARHVPNLAQRVLHGALVIASTLGIAFAFTFGVLEPVVYLLPALAFSLLGMAAMAGWLVARLRRPIVLAPLALVVAVLGWLWIGEARGRARRLEAEDAALHARWRALPIERGIVVWTTDDHMRLVAWQVLAGEHPAVTVVDPAVLTWPAPRHAFERRFGFDPLAGLTLRANAGLSDVGPNIARQTGLPVIDFEQFQP